MEIIVALLSKVIKFVAPWRRQFIKIIGRMSLFKCQYLSTYASYVYYSGCKNCKCSIVAIIPVINLLSVDVPWYQL